LSKLSPSVSMNPKAHWKRPERWLAFFLTLLAVCSFLAMVPVTPELSPGDGLEATGSESELSFIDQLRGGFHDVVRNRNKLGSNGDTYSHYTAIVLQYGYV